ncbi:MAG: hypothetical protein FD149_2514 [Rhodospirillaceae bacterium]|nr:MAG: hypothetical protein FD149_2514 [Rhodospirillaceae bacterium]
MSFSRVHTPRRAAAEQSASAVASGLQGVFSGLAGWSAFEESVFGVFMIHAHSITFLPHLIRRTAAERARGVALRERLRVVVDPACLAFALDAQVPSARDLFSRLP